MPEITRTAIENRIKEVAPGIKSTDLRRARKLHMRRLDSYLFLPTHEEALLLVKAIGYSDPTGETATTNVLAGATP